jgi:magnesium-transporting ATPase (P-type)
MTVADFYTCEKVYQGRPSEFNSLPTSQLIIESILYNCSARIEKSDSGAYETKGNVTEQGLINFLMDFGVPAYDAIRLKDDNILEIIPFSSMRKRATTAVRLPED